MEKSVIDYIFNDAQESIELGETYEKLCSESDDMYNKIKKFLDKKQYEEFDSFVNKELLIEAEASEKHFKEGVKMGVRLAVECLYLNKK